jgi:hypothetical protein
MFTLLVQDCKSGVLFLEYDCPTLVNLANYLLNYSIINAYAGFQRNGGAGM